MKKTLSATIILVVILTLSVLLIACTDGELSVESYDIKETTVKVGDTYSAAASITAHMSDGTTKTVSNNLIYKEEDVDKLALDEGKYTKAGTYSIRIYHLEEREEFYLGEWVIVVKAVK